MAGMADDGVNLLRSQSYLDAVTTARCILSDAYSNLVRLDVNLRACHRACALDRTAPLCPLFCAVRMETNLCTIGRTLSQQTRRVVTKAWAVSCHVPSQTLCGTHFESGSTFPFPT